MQRDQALFEPASTADQTAFEPPSIDAGGVRLALAVAGRRVTGRIDLAAPNPKGRRTCTVDYVAPKSWADDHHAAALRVVAHWFRDIGGFANVAKRHLCHVLQRLAEGIAEDQVHAAIRAYAASDWHREGKRWTTIQRFFVRDLLDKWIDESPELRRERDQANTSAADAELRRRFDAQYARERAARRAQREQAERTRAAQSSEPRAQAPGAVGAGTSPAATPCQSIAEAIARLPQGDRWILPTLLSRRADPAAKARAKARAEETLVALWRHLPEATRSGIDARVQLAIHRRTGQLTEVGRLPLPERRRLRLAQLLRLMQTDRRTALPTVGDALAADPAARVFRRESRP